MDNVALAQLFARPVPRYTSYPTAPQFSAAVDDATHSGWLKAVPRDTRVSLYIHVPFCVQLCWYCACHTGVANRYSTVASYCEALLAEIAIVRRSLGFRAKVGHIHWGGGTPTVLKADDFARLGEALGDAFDIEPDAEVAVEIDPRTLDDEIVEALGRVNATRVSFGVQDFDARVQAAINRIQPFALTRDAVRRMRDAGISSVNLDLIYGLPLQTVDSLRATVAQAVELAPDRIALFGYAHVPWMKPHQKLIREADLPGPAARWAQAQAAAEALQGAGYAAIGIDHFAQPGDGLARAAAEGRLRRNFQGYTTDLSDCIIGFGASAISSLPAGYAQNATDVRGWRERVNFGSLPTARGVALSSDDLMRRDVIERLMCDLAVDLDATARRHGKTSADFEDAAPALDQLKALGVIDGSGPIIRVNTDARPLARLVAAAFDRYLAAGFGRHSVAV